MNCVRKKLNRIVYAYQSKNGIIMNVGVSVNN